MQLIIGGAFSGKRKIVREMKTKCSWLSAYDGDSVSKWDVRWEKDSTLVMEGWENWLAEKLISKKNSNDIRRNMQSFFQSLKEEEQKRDNDIVLIMLEIGRGIVPLQKDERMVRDLTGWVAQDAAEVADEVYYVWNGLSKKIK
ncbi:bifunctional adenosylcobinamide kinase/adenosylcobinamide-phosphate guanylyltransferase [Halalkalibacter alkaliphilus]|uniref:Adenosylcobinamide kinase n=1 Tax=Halalkalibacter alkaliphilus TaxID=2917993 RepID=A0A9X2CNE5_9BACI|nr:bifunctional adenosylcobinamide kinase/adenosylcobinamide-phosphate guanylyltransferase [Halalkalibacter alkaliphilus]MCL7746578.1 bifunctional adenosylcobinamide kinase/adenosylcobinamide-phosphate guanylyltransferase [Halalkalibacter alkaliphilus]